MFELNINEFENESRSSELNNEITMMEERKITSTPIMDFYRDKTILLTGGTGFIGRLLVEKLLRINVKQIILLSRPKKGKTIKERCEELFSGVVFMNLKKNFPNFLDRVHIIDADLQKPNLGISLESQEYIINNTQIVFHAASDVRFDQAIKKAIEINVRGTRDLLNICQKIIHLESFIYISTAYSNCPRSHISEEFYPPPADPDQMIKLTELMDQTEMDLETLMNTNIKTLIEPWPNTYVYTKALTEEVVRRYGQLLPISVVRPSIIIATMEEPIEGWTDNIYGLNGIIVGIALGLIRVMLVNDNNNQGDIIPADFVVNSILVVGWQTYIERKHDSAIEAKTGTEASVNGIQPKTKIYNCVTAENPISFDNIYQYSIKVGKTCPPKRSLWVVCYNTTSSKIMFEYYKFMYHNLPAFFIDLYLRMINRTPRVIDLYKKVHKFSAVIEYFTNHTWKFENRNMITLREKLTPDDKLMFPCDVNKIVWTDFFWTYIHGLRRHIVNESLQNQEEALVRYQKMKTAHYLILTVYYSIWTIIIYYVLKWIGLCFV